MRKTIEVARIKEIVNDMILNSLDDDKSSREHMSLVLEAVLIETGNYSGFQYLSRHDMESSFNGTSYGINDDLTFGGTDRTRVRYF
jgi:hypothetical protein